MSDCVFCRIINGDLPADIVYEDNEIIAFRDVNPQAPVHLLVIPRQHCPTLADAAADGRYGLLGRLFACAVKLAAQEDLGNGYRIVANCGDDGGQYVHHVHLHVLGGRELGWPPG